MPYRKLVNIFREKYHSTYIQHQAVCFRTKTARKRDISSSINWERDMAGNMSQWYAGGVNRTIFAGCAQNQIKWMHGVGAWVQAQMQKFALILARDVHRNSLCSIFNKWCKNWVTCGATRESSSSICLRVKAQAAGGFWSLLCSITQHKGMQNTQAQSQPVCQ